MYTQENELYYLGRSLRSNHGQEEPSYSLRKESVQEDVYDGIDEDDDEGRIYDRISHNSDIMDDHETWVLKCMT